MIRIRVADIPALIIGFAICVLLMVGFLFLFKNGSLDANSFPRWLFMLIFLGIIVLGGAAGSKIWGFVLKSRRK